MRINRLFLITGSALCVASPVVAQQPEMSMMTAMHCGAGTAMMRGMAPGYRAMPDMSADSMHRMMMMMMGPPTPNMILSYRSQLGLSTDQMARLEALQKAAEPVCAEHMRLAMEAHRAANQMLEPASPDFMAYAAKLREMAGHIVEAHVTMAKAAVAARNDLTPAQRTTLKNLMAQMHR